MKGRSGSNLCVNCCTFVCLCLRFISFAIIIFPTLYQWSLCFLTEPKALYCLKAIRKCLRLDLELCAWLSVCLLYTSDAADDWLVV